MICKKHIDFNQLAFEDSFTSCMTMLFNRKNILKLIAHLYFLKEI